LRKKGKEKRGSAPESVPRTERKKKRAAPGTKKLLGKPLIEGEKEK